MTKKSPPKTAFYKVTNTIEGESVVTNSVVVEATSESEAAAFIASKSITAEPYPVEKLVAYIKAGGEPIKVPPKAKRPYAKKAHRTVSRETPGIPEVAPLAQEPAPADSITTN